MQLRLTVEVLAGVAQVERHLRDAGGARARRRRLARKPFGPRRRLLFPKRTVRPLPRRLPIGLGELSGRVQVVAVDGVGLALDDGRYRHGAAGGGQVQVLGGAAAAVAAGSVFPRFCATARVDRYPPRPGQAAGCAGGQDRIAGDAARHFQPQYAQSAQADF